MEIEQLQGHAQHIRKLVLDQIYHAQSGHPGGSLSAADLLTVLYFEEMKINKENISSIHRDRFVLSKGHVSALLYAVLAEKGFLSEAELLTFRRLNSRLQGHPNMHYVDGVDMSTGSLGQGISAAVGMALAAKLDRMDHRIYTLLGDGECQEGQVWEACMSAAHYHLDQLCVIIDHNHLQIDGEVELVMNVDSLENKFAGFNFHVITIDGHNITQIKDAFCEARRIKGKPTVIIANTIKGKGVSFMEHKASWHGSAPNKEQYVQAVQELGGFQV